MKTMKLLSNRIHSIPYENEIGLNKQVLICQFISCFVNIAAPSGIRDSKYVCKTSGYYYRDDSSFYHCYDDDYTVQHCAPGKRHQISQSLHYVPVLLLEIISASR